MQSRLFASPPDSSLPHAQSPTSSGRRAAEGGASLGRLVPLSDDRAAKPAERGPPPDASADPTTAGDCAAGHPLANLGTAGQPLDHPESFIVQPQLFIDEPQQFIVQPQLLIDEPHQFIVQPRLFIDEPRQLVVQPQLFIDEPRQLVAEPQRFIVDPRPWLADKQQWLDERRPWLVDQLL